MTDRMTLKTILRLALASACVATSLVGSARQVSAQSSIAAIACAFTLNAGFSPALTMTPSSGQMTLGGTGVCVVNEEIATAAFSASVFTLAPLSTCVSGAYAGLGSFTTSSNNLPGFSGVAVSVENVGGAFTMTLIEGIYIFDAVGTFAQTAVPQPASCVSGTPQGGASLTGAIAGQDPVLPIKPG